MQTYLINFLAAIFLVAAIEKIAAPQKFIESLDFMPELISKRVIAAGSIILELSFIILIDVEPSVCKFLMGGFIGILAIYQLLSKGDRACSCMGPLDEMADRKYLRLRIAVIACIFLAALTSRISTFPVEAKIVAISSCLIVLAIAYLYKIKVMRILEA